MFGGNSLFGQNKIGGITTGGGGLFNPTSQQQQPSLFNSNAATVSQPGSLFNQQTAQKPSFFPTTTSTQQSSLFSSSTAPKLNTTGIFGANASQPAQTGFFANTTQSNSLFGQPAAQKSIFGQNSTGSTVRFDPLISTDTMIKNNESKQVNTKHMCITAMKQYEMKSLEELRVEDYLANRKGPQQQQGLAGGGSLFQSGTQTANTSGTSIFNSGVTQNKPGGLFQTNAAPAAGSSLFQTKIGGGLTSGGGGLFNPTSQQQQPSLFNSNVAAVSQPGSLFNQQTVQKPSFFPTTTSTQQSSLFPSSAPKLNTTGIFEANTSQPAQTGFFTNTTQSNSLFPSTTQKSMFNTIAQPSNPVSTGTGLFATTAPKTGGFFATQSTASTGGIFSQNNQLLNSSTSMFNSQAQQKPAQTFFNTAGGMQMGQQQPVSTMMMPQQQGAALPIYISAQVQQEIIEAQLAALPYGDSPLLKPRRSVASSSSTTANGEKSLTLQSNSPAGLQQQLRFLSPLLSSLSSSGNVAPTTTSITQSITSPISAIAPSLSNGTANRTANGSLSSSNEKIAYKSLVSLPSLGFSAALGMNSPTSYLNSPSGGQSMKTRSFLTNASKEGDFSSRSNGRQNIKALDTLVIESKNEAPLSKPLLESSPSPVPLDIAALDRTLSTTVNDAELSTTTIHKEGASGGSGAAAVNWSSMSNPSSPTATEFSGLDFIQQHLQIKSPTAPYETTLADKSSANQSKLDFGASSTPKAKSTEKTIIIDEDTAHSGCSIRGQTPKSSDPVDLVTSLWASKSDYYCHPPIDELLKARLVTRDGAVIYQVKKDGLTIGRTGYGSVFWPGPFELTDLNFEPIITFRNKEVVVYPNDAKKPPVGKELNRPAEISLDNVWPIGKNHESIKDSNDLLRLKFREKLDIMCRKMGAEFKNYEPSTGTWCFAVTHFSKYGFDNSVVDEDLSLLVDVKPVLLERKVLHKFRGLTSDVLAHSVLKMCKKYAPVTSIQRRSCRVSFGQNSILARLSSPNEYLTSVSFSTVSTVPCLQEYFKQYLTVKDRLSEFEEFRRSELLRWDPPSLLLRLLDAYVLSSVSEIFQRIYFGKWLRMVLAKSDVNRSLLMDVDDTIDDDSNSVVLKSAVSGRFRKIYGHLLNGAVEKARVVAVENRLYNLAVLISLFKRQPGTMVQGQVMDQLNACKHMRHVDADYVRILELLCGAWTPKTGEAVNWMQVLGAIVWYAAKPSTTLNDCVELFKIRYVLPQTQNANSNGSGGFLSCLSL